MQLTSKVVHDLETLIWLTLTSTSLGNAKFEHSTEWLKE